MAIRSAKATSASLDRARPGARRAARTASRRQAEHVGAGLVHGAGARGAGRAPRRAAASSTSGCASSSRSRASRVGRAQREQHRQRRHALAQVGPGGLAGLLGVAADVEDVVGELEGDTDLLAVLASARRPPRRARRRTSRRTAPRWRSASRSCRRRPAGSASSGSWPSGGGWVSRIWPSTSRVNVSRLDPHRLGAELGGELGGLREQPVAREDRHVVVPAGVRRVGTAAQRGLVHHVVVVERGEVGQLDDAGRGDAPRRRRGRRSRRPAAPAAAGTACRRRAAGAGRPR